MPGQLYRTKRSQFRAVNPVVFMIISMAIPSVFKARAILRFSL